MRVLDLVQSRQEIFWIRDDTTVHETALYLRAHRVRAVGVLDGAGQLVGVVSQSDISDKVAAENKCPAWMRVSEIMSQNLVVVRPDFLLDECLRLMEKHDIFHLLIMGDVGQFSRNVVGGGPASGHRLGPQGPRRHVRGIRVSATIEPVLEQRRARSIHTLVRTFINRCNSARSPWPMAVNSTPIPLRG